MQKHKTMKSHFLQFGILLAIGLLTLQKGQAQLPDGSIAPDFTATDINGVEHNLYALLDSGYQVILNFSATWCGPCWSYHESGIKDELYEVFGLEGSNEIRLFFIEGDDTTTQQDLEGTDQTLLGTGSQERLTPSLTMDKTSLTHMPAHTIPPFTPFAQAAS